MTKNDFHTALFQANLLYGIEMNNDTFEEIGLIAHGIIGNKNMKLYHVTLEIDKTSLSVQLPCNCEQIVSVTYLFEDWNYTSNKENFGDTVSGWIEHYTEHQKMFTDPLYTHGKYAEYEQVGNTLYFKHPGKVHILYRGEELDDDGLPYINDKEVNAIAAYIAYIAKYKEGLKLANKGFLEMANMLKADWVRLADEARTPEYINQNDLNEILEVKTSWNRKTFNKSFKPIV